MIHLHEWQKLLYNGYEKCRDESVFLSLSFIIYEW